MEQKRCSHCKNTKPTSEFYRRGGKLNRRDLTSQCASCMVIINKAMRRVVKQKAIDYLGGKCIICGYNKCQAAFDFHHRDRRTKEYTIGDTGRKSFDETLIKELDKCDLLCRNCHCKLHSLEPLLSRIKIIPTTNETKKRCNRCNEHKFLYEFPGKNGKRCKICEGIYGAETLEIFKKLCVEYGGGCCQVCGYKDCLDALSFHHLYPNEKEFNISTQRRRVLPDWIKNELDKCLLVCQNCHREIHFNSDLESCPVYDNLAFHEEASLHVPSVEQ